MTQAYFAETSSASAGTQTIMAERMINDNIKLIFFKEAPPFLPVRANPIQFHYMTHPTRLFIRIQIIRNRKRNYSFKNV